MKYQFIIIIIIIIIMSYVARMRVVQLTTTPIKCWLAAEGTISASECRDLIPIEKRFTEQLGTPTMVSHEKKLITFLLGQGVDR